MSEIRRVRRVTGRIAALSTGLVAVFLMALMVAPAAHAAVPNPETILSAWKSDPLYVESGSALSSSQANEIRSSLRDSKYPIYVAALPDNTVTGANAENFLRTLGLGMRDQGKTKFAVAVLDGNTLFASSSSLRPGEAGRLARQATSANSDVVAGMKDFVDMVNVRAEGGRVSTGTGSSSSGSGVGALVSLLVIGLVGGLGFFAYSRKKRKDTERREARELAAVKQTVDEDVTKLGEEITALDLDVKMLENRHETLDDWQKALDSYERAKSELVKVKRPDEFRGVTGALEEGRYALACVKARVNREPLPERRVPCFFNPQHGPSVRDVRWAPPGGTPRDVPACAADSVAIEQGYDPQMREVMVDGKRVPYWNAGPAYQPYAYGYYGGAGDLMSMMLVGTLLGSAMSGGWGYGGYGGGDAGGGGDLGGGGGDFGGGDFGGGFDFGGDF
ncbi:hypothetical protein [Rhizohabitans arisaemae]|uniref:hypothetical protein n=1 Tax=Rhizohabitans arisaemae TaxID=2720610 RepID=UPI0024B0F32B|nr:hypothetical protein [Rhizohabitans arisaemae]